MMGFREVAVKGFRLASIGLRDPVELLDRVAIAREGRLEPDLGPGSRVSESGIAVPRSLEEAAVCLGLGRSTVDGAADADRTWSALQREWEEFWSTVGYVAGHDADPALVRTVWLSCRVLRPDVVVETGVGRGVSTAAVLHALERNRSGRLISIDLPPLADPWFSASAELVPDRLRHRWEYRRGSVRRVLPKLLHALRDAGESIDLYIADSLHTAVHIEWEVGLAVGSMTPGGVVVVDDVETWVKAFPDVPGRSVLAHDSKGGLFALLRS